MKDIKESILLNCKALIDENGVHEVSVRKLVKASGCSLRSLYNNFENLDAVYHEVMDEFTLDIRDFILARFPGIPTSDDELYITYSSFVSYFLEYPNRFYFMYLYKHNRPSEQEPLFASQDFQLLIKDSHEYLLDEHGVSSEEIYMLHQRIIYGLFGLLTLYFTENFSLTKDMVLPAFKDFYYKQINFV